MLDWNAVSDSGYIHAVGRDVTDERALARDRERIWTLSPVLKVVATTGGEIQTVNPSWTKVLGWTPQQTVGRNVMDFVAEIEDEFDIIISMNQQAEIENYGQLVDAVTKLQAD